MTIRKKILQTAGAGALLALSAGVAQAALATYIDDFQGYGAAATFAPWAGFSDNAGLGAYSFPPSTTGPQITALADDGGGNEYMNFYANYDNGPVHNNPPLQEAISVFIQQTFSGAEAAGGATWTFDFDFASNPDAPVTGDTEVGAFIRVFDAAFNLLDGDTLNTLAATPVFQDGKLSVTMNPAWENGGIIQFGFNNLVGNYDGSGRFYDNACWTNDGGASCPSAVPIPAAVWLFGSGLVGLVGVARRRKS